MTCLGRCAGLIHTPCTVRRPSDRINPYGRQATPRPRPGDRQTSADSLHAIAATSGAQRLSSPTHHASRDELRSRHSARTPRTSSSPGSCHSSRRGAKPDASPRLLAPLEPLLHIGPHIPPVPAELHARHRARPRRLAHPRHRHAQPVGHLLGVEQTVAQTPHRPETEFAPLAKRRGLSVSLERRAIPRPPHAPEFFSRRGAECPPL